MGREKEPRRKTKPVAAASNGEFLSTWLKVEEKKIGKHRRLLLSEEKGKRSAILETLQRVVQGHYVDPAVAAERLKMHGATKTADLLREMLPVRKTSRSGDLGEILASEVAIHIMGFIVPIRRLQWKDGRDMALRGDDLVAFSIGAKRTRYLKGESKSRGILTASIVDEADVKLLEDTGRPSRHSILFVANRLYERGDSETAAMLEAHLLDSFRECDIQHLLFTFSGNSADKLLVEHLSERAGPECHAVGLHVADHQDFIASVYEGTA